MINIWNYLFKSFYYRRLFISFVLEFWSELGDEGITVDCCSNFGDELAAFVQLLLFCEEIELIVCIDCCGDCDNGSGLVGIGGTCLLFSSFIIKLLVAPSLRLYELLLLLPLTVLSLAVQLNWNNKKYFN